MAMARVPKLVSPQVSAPAVPAGRAANAAGAADDRELVRRAQAEDKAAFEELVRRHQHRVFAVAGGILLPRGAVGGIAQHRLLKGYVPLRQFDQPGAFITRLYTITLNARL